MKSWHAMLLKGCTVLQEVLCLFILFLVVLFPGCDGAFLILPPFLTVSTLGRGSVFIYAYVAKIF